MIAPQPTMVPQLGDNVHKWQGRERSRSPGRVLNINDKFEIHCFKFQTDRLLVETLHEWIGRKEQFQLEGEVIVRASIQSLLRGQTN